MPQLQHTQCYTLLLLNLRSAVYKLVLPEVVSWVLDEFDKSDEQTPWVRTIHYESLEQNSRDLLLNGLSIGLRKQREESTAEVVGVAIGIAKLVGNGIQEEVTT